MPRRLTQRSAEQIALGRARWPGEAKPCVRCAVLRPLDAFGANRSRRDGLNSECRPCAAQRSRAFYERNADRVRPLMSKWTREYQRTLSRRSDLEIQHDREQAHPDGEKSCSRCGIAKPLISFLAARNRRDGLDSRCRACRRASDRKYRAEHLHEVNARQRSYDRKHYHTDLGASRAHGRARERRRRVRDLDAMGWPSMLAVYAGMCAYCGVSRADSIDHVIPLSRGGPHATENIIPACFSCNASKNNKTALEFILWRLEVA